MWGNRTAINALQKMKMIKLKKYRLLVNQKHDILDIKMDEKFEWKYLNISEVILSLYDKNHQTCVTLSEFQHNVN